VKVSANVKIILSILLILILIHHFSNILEWTDIYPSIDIYDDYIEILQPLIWLFLFYGFIQQMSKENLRISERKYMEAYNRLDFYKDLLAHDMANILNNINSSIQMLEIWEGDPKKLEKKEELRKIISKQVERGENLISNMKKLSKLENQGQQLKTINVKEIIIETIEQFEPDFNNEQIEILTDFPKEKITVKGGPLLLDVFDNLLLNAYIHNKSNHKKVWINLTKTQIKKEHYAKIEFMDNGIGIPEERKETIFKRDYNQSKSTGGMGIGLSLVKKIIEEYTGKIWVENRIKGDHTKGSNFIVLLKQEI
jgi:signal transduction histidine kinase